MLRAVHKLAGASERARVLCRTRSRSSSSSCLHAYHSQTPNPSASPPSASKSNFGWHLAPLFKQQKRGCSQTWLNSAHAALVKQLDHWSMLEKSDLNFKELTAFPWIIRLPFTTRVKANIMACYNLLILCRRAFRFPQVIIIKNKRVCISF